MKKTVDYTEAKANRDRRLMKQCESEGTPQKAELKELFDTLFRREAVRRSRPTNQMRLKRVTEEHYKTLCELAWINGGRVELDWNETCGIATLTYWGNELILDRDFTPELEGFTQILAESDTTNLSAEENNFKLLLSFDLGADCPL